MSYSFYFFLKKENNQQKNSTLNINIIFSIFEKPLFPVTYRHLARHSLRQVIFVALAT